MRPIFSSLYPPPTFYARSSSTYEETTSNRSYTNGSSSSTSEEEEGDAVKLLGLVQNIRRSGSHDDLVDFVVNVENKNKNINSNKTKHLGTYLDATNMNRHGDTYNQGTSLIDAYNKSVVDAYNEVLVGGGESNTHKRKAYWEDESRARGGRVA